MRNVRCIRSPVGLAACVAVLLWLWPGPALAHKMYIFARFQAETARGRVYFRGNTPADGVTVEAFDPAGQKVGQTRTDAQGEFTLPLRSKDDVKLMAVTDDGHAAEPFVLRAAGGAGEFSVVDPGPNQSAPGPSTSETTQPPLHRPAATPDRKTLEAVVEAAVSRQVAPVREQLAAMQDRITFRDYVGGIGYIVGLMGLAFYFLGVRRRGARAGGPNAEDEAVRSQRPAEAERPGGPGGS
jgi:nickel transport protein